MNDAIRIEWPTVDPASLAWLETDHMVEVDRVMVEDLGIALIQMMENAGRNLARLVLATWSPRRVAVCAGSGGNGGGGLVAARHLANAGVDVEVLSTRPRQEYSGVPRHQYDIVERMGVPTVDELGEPDVLVDAVIGYSLRGAPGGRAAELIQAMEAHRAPVVALDVPSGLDTSTGFVAGAIAAASATMTLAMPKVGLRGQPLVGRLFLGDISVPPTVYRQLGFDVDSPFVSGPIVEVTGARHR